MVKLYLYERNISIVIFFTPFSQQVLRNHISETEIKCRIKFFMKFYTEVGGEIGHSEGKNLWSKGPLCYIQPRLLTWRALTGLEYIYKMWIPFSWHSSMYERSGSCAKLTWCPSSLTYFARALRWMSENEFYFLNNTLFTLYNCRRQSNCWEDTYSCCLFQVWCYISNEQLWWCLSQNCSYYVDRYCTPLFYLLKHIKEAKTHPVNQFYLQFK